MNSQEWHVLVSRLYHRLPALLDALDAAEADRERLPANANIIAACINADWMQIVFNGGPPCFHLEGNQFCFRAQRWDGHEDQHAFVSLLDFYRAARLADRGEGK